MKGNVRAGLIALATWSVVFLVIGAGMTVCSSCGSAASAASRISCPGR